MTTIGLLSYSGTPLEYLPPRRLRALLAEATLQGAVFALLNSSHYDIHKRRIQADVWTLSDGWHSEIVQLPDVVIIVGTPLNENQRTLENWIYSCRTVISNKGVDKVTLSGLLTGTGCEQYLIPWSAVPKSDTAVFVRDFIKKQSGAVIKRADGQKGIGIFFVTPDQHGWVVRYDDKLLCGTLDEVVGFVTKRIAGRLQYRDYIIQRYINSAAPDGRPFDVRVHVQRRADGNWAVTRGYVRLAEANNPLPNVSRGGYQGSLPGIFGLRGAERSERIESELYKAAIDVARTQDAATSCPLYELGLDFVVDEGDYVWLIESNAFPQSSLHEHERAVHTIGYALSYVAATDDSFPPRDL